MGKFPKGKVEVKEIDSCGDSIGIRVVDDSFDGKSLLKRHKEINECLRQHDLLDCFHSL